MSSIDQAQKDGVVLGLSSHPDTFNLFLLALEKLQLIKDPETGKDIKQDKMGWFQVAAKGINGLPKEAWDNVSGHTEGSDEGDGSYCPHGTIFFPTWHRPYLALLEQTIFASIREIASEFNTDKNRWLAAAKVFRLPYWDYYRPRSKNNTVFNGVRNTRDGVTSFPYNFAAPFIFSFPEIMLFRPKVAEDKPVKVRNPLYSYEFYQGISVDEWNQLDTDDIGRKQLIHASRKLTTRYPDTNRGEKSHADAMNAAHNSSREPKLSLLLNMMKTPPYDSYPVFASTDSNDPDIARGSLEGLHNAYHRFIGGSGHMSRVPVAAFDPIFWMHHANIDRLLSVWLATHSSWIPSQRDRIAKLYPFRNVKTDSMEDFWDSDKSRTSEAFGYTYPDVDGLTSEQVTERFGRNYSWSLHETLRPGIGSEPPKEMEPIPVLDTYFFKVGDGLGGVLPPTDIETIVISPFSSGADRSQKVVANQNNEAVITLPSAQLSSHITKEAPGRSNKDLLSNEPKGTHLIRQWFLDTAVKRGANNGSFTIFFFVGQFTDEPANYISQPTLAGVIHLFVAPKELCRNCALQADDDAIAYDTTPITPILLDYIDNNSDLQSLHPDDVVPFLQANLHTRVVGES